MPGDRDIERAIVDLLARRAPGASICPSEAARGLWPDDWRAGMPRVRAVAAALAADGRLRVTQGAAGIAADDVRDAAGPIRLRRGPAFPGAAG